MQVKVFESPDMASGLRMVRKELGPDALILSTRTVRNGKLGLLGKPVLEITAAIDSVTSPEALPLGHMQEKTQKITTAHRSYLEHDGSSPDVHCVRPHERRDEQGGLMEMYQTEIDPKKEMPSRLNANHSPKKMLHEIEELKDMVHSLTGEVSRLKPSAGEPAPQMQERPVSKESTPLFRMASENGGKEIPIADTAFSSLGNPLATCLMDNGVSRKTAEMLSDLAKKSLRLEDISQPEKVLKCLHETIASQLQICPPSFEGKIPQQRIALVGATGVGKTTTLAKIAASFLSRHSNSIALITIDTYRIAAIEQLKVYGEIMHLPVDVVITPDQMAQALEKHQNKDLILIDTAGRSPRDNVSIDELATFLNPEFNIEKHLVLSAVTREAEILESIRRFNALLIDRTIFTKIDECGNLGVLLNIQLNNSSPISYITNGQRVPEDLLEIERETVPQLVIPPTQGSEP